MSLRVLFFMLILLSQMVLGEVVASKPDHIKSDAWNKVEPYLLPEDHTLKPLLDAIFSKSRANLSLKTMKKAGFVEAHPRRWTHLIVTTHPDVPGYVFKIYLDAQRYYNGIKEYEQWLKRIKGVHLIRDEIERRGWQDTFKTPKKWIYILPAEPSPPKEFIRKDFILVEEDMNIFDHKKN
jgi:hypothetical protein